MSETTAYYKAAGRSLAAVEKYIADGKAALREWKAFAKRNGATRYMTNHGIGERRFGGLVDDPQSPLWRKHRDAWVPRRDSKEARAISDDMGKLPTLRLGLDAGGLYVGEDCRTCTPGFEKLDGGYVILHHEKADPPLDSIPMKRSDYWKPKESAKK